MAATRRNLQSAWGKKKARIPIKITKKGSVLVQRLLKHYSLETAQDKSKRE